MAGSGKGLNVRPVDTSGVMHSHPAVRKVMRVILLATAGLGFAACVLSRAAPGDVVERLRSPNGWWIVAGILAVSTSVGCHALPLLTTVLLGFAGWLALHAFAGIAKERSPTLT